jgi:hypothetical protein
LRSSSRAAFTLSAISFSKFAIRSAKSVKVQQAGVTFDPLPIAFHHGVHLNAPGDKGRRPLFPEEGSWVMASPAIEACILLIINSMKISFQNWEHSGESSFD